MARDFNGSDQDLQYAGAIVSDEPFTMACWFNLDVNNATQMLMWVGDAGNDLAEAVGVENTEFLQHLSAHYSDAHRGLF